MVNKKNAFWQALISAVLIFGIGLLLGVFLEDYRSKTVETALINSEINALDQQILQQINSNFKIDCTLAENKIVKFADRIYGEAKTLEDYDDSSDLTTTLKILHKRYDLLRTLLWVQSTELKETCDSDYNIIVYLYQYSNPTIETRSSQTAFARYLEDLKEEYGNEIILIPIAGDLDLDSLNLLTESYKIRNYPAVILNNEIVIRKIDNLPALRDVLKSS